MSLDWNKLTAEQKAEVVAKAIGWKLPDDPGLPRAWLRRDSKLAKARPDLGAWAWAGYWAVEPELVDDPDDYGQKHIPSYWYLCGSAVWRPTEDIAQAWKVLGVIQQRMGLVELLGGIHLWPGGKRSWRCRLRDGGKGGDPVTVDVVNATVADAICHAAVLAVGACE